MVASELTGEKGTLNRLGSRYWVLRGLSRVRLAQRSRRTVGSERIDGKKHACNRAVSRLGRTRPNHLPVPLGNHDNSQRYHHCQ